MRLEGDEKCHDGIGDERMMRTMPRYRMTMKEVKTTIKDDDQRQEGKSKKTERERKRKRERRSDRNKYENEESCQAGGRDCWREGFKVWMGLLEYADGRRPCTRRKETGKGEYKREPKKKRTEVRGATRKNKIFFSGNGKAKCEIDLEERR